MRAEFGWRYTVLGLAFAAVSLIIVAQLVHIQINPRTHLVLEQSDVYVWEEKIVYPPRGQIYDRWGHLLAGNKTIYEIGVELRAVRNEEDARAIAFAVNAIIGTDFNQVYQKASQEFVEGVSVYAVLADYVPSEKALMLQEYIKEQQEKAEASRRSSKEPSLNAIVLFPHLERSYPENDLASNVLGFVSRRDGRGYIGVEEYYQDILAGTPVTVLVPRDPNLVEELPQIPPGDSLILTLDREIQAEVERILDQSVEQYGAKSGVIVIMDPQTGEILAMAAHPRQDLSQYWEYEKVLANRAISVPYEPGSVFKVLTVSAALDAGVVEPDTPFYDKGVIEVGGIYIRNWNGAAWGPQDVTGCIQHSLNVCLAWIGTELGAEKFYDYMQAFGVGRATGLDLAGEVSGRLKIPGDGDWYDADLGTNTFGQGVAVTPMQLLMAVSAFANEGYMVTPRIVRALLSNGSQYEISPQFAGAPISPETVETVKRMLVASLAEEGSKALVNGYTLAGKTGTAQIPGDKGYKENGTNASFVGWGPVDDPRFAVFVWFEEPSASIWGSEVAAPVFARVVERLVILLDLPPDDVRVTVND